MALKVSEKLLGGSNRCFIIAEIGQNHQGNVNTAKEMIRKAAECGVDCVKFQRSNLEAKFTKSALDRLYPSPNSFGATYGDHKKFLEFSSEDFRELKTFTEDCGLIFSASAMDPVALDELISLEVDFIKIGSGDANNFPLLEKGKLSGRPLIISTGMQDQGTIERINELIGEEPFGLLHCVSCYPTSPEDANLQLIPEFRKNFRQATVGYSGHELETEIISLAAVAMGAKILERHFTLGKSLKGSDHKCSLEPQEMKKLVKNIRECFQEIGHCPGRGFSESDRSATKRHNGRRLPEKVSV
ncbi:Sialic acid synthase [Sergentomyia squamirostris]